MLRWIQVLLLLPLTVAANTQACGQDPGSPCKHHVSSATKELFDGYFHAKSVHDSATFTKYFDQQGAVYCDSVLGYCLSPYVTIAAAFTTLLAVAPPSAISYYLDISGDITSGALVHYVDSPSFFGAEIRTISVFDFMDDEIVRQVDYWDGRKNSVTNTRLPDIAYQYQLGLDMVANRTVAAPLQNTIDALSTFFQAGNATAAAALFSTDAVFEDFTLRTYQEGQLAIGRYLQRALGRLPYGPGSTVRHILGTNFSGGYEWGRGVSDPTRGGVIALDLCPNGTISRFRTVWDSSRVADTILTTLTTLVIE